MVDLEALEKMLDVGMGAGKPDLRELIAEVRALRAERDALLGILDHTMCGKTMKACVALRARVSELERAGDALFESVNGSGWQSRREATMEAWRKAVRG